MIVRLPIRLESEANRRDHWSARARRVKCQRRAVWAALIGLDGRPSLPVVVTITRIAPRSLDTDNLAGACKAVRDQVATWLGVDDAPGSGVEWRYDQWRSLRGDHTVEIQIERTP